MCAGYAAARTANANAKIQERYRGWQRFHKTTQNYSRYNLRKISSQIQISNITRGLHRAWSNAQGKLNALEDKVWAKNQGAFVKAMQNSKFANLQASGRALGKSSARFGIMEAGELGRYYAANVRSLTDAQQQFKAGMKYSRDMAKNEMWKSFANVSFTPTPDIKEPKGVRQSTTMALLGDVLGVAGTAASIAFAAGSDSRLKKDIKKIGKSIEGHNIYKFKYLDEETEYIGVMAEEVYAKKREAVVRMPNGYFGVDYSKIDVEFREVAK